MEVIPDVSPEIPRPTWRLILAALGKLPQRGMSRGFGRIADLPIPRPARVAVLSAFARAVGVNLGEVELPLAEYPTLNAFFVRRLREGARRWPTDPATICSPVDGIVGRFGIVRAGLAIQAKGHSYSVADLLTDSNVAERFDGGAFLTIYLSPRHYHRIHTPCAGGVVAATYVPGTLLPVNAPAVMHVPGLFVRNERLITHLEGARGRIAVVAVGAYNVGRISAAFDSEWSGMGRESWISNRSRPVAPQRSYSPPIPVETGAEIMAFHLGSTVVLLFEPGTALREDLEQGMELRIGEPIGG